MKNVVIIGAGPAGLTAAYELLQRAPKEYSITILEESNAIGGISKTVKYKNNRMDIGGHRFFSKDQQVMDWWQKMMPRQGKPSFDDIKLHREKKLAAGGNFAALAKEFSVDTGAKENGGDLGWNRPAVFVKPFADAVKNMKKGEISKAPVKTEFGWHIIKVNDVKEVPFPSYDSVKDQIREGLELKKQQNFLNELMKTNKIEYAK